MVNYFGKNANDIVFEFNGLHVINSVHNSDAHKEILWEADKVFNIA